MITLKKIIKIADSAYPDGLVGKCAKAKKNEDLGDTLALFVARELKDVYGEEDHTGRKLTDRDKLDEAIRTMRVAIRELTAVEVALIQAKKELK